MLRQYPILALASVLLATPVAAQDAGTVAGRPALSTTSAADLIAQREKWGTAPGAATTAKAAIPGEPPPPSEGKAARAAAVAAATYAILPTDDVNKLIAEREKWGKGPSGYETKKVLAPPAAGTGKKLKRVKVKSKGKVTKVSKKRKRKSKN